MYLTNIFNKCQWSSLNLVAKQLSFVAIGVPLTTLIHEMEHALAVHILYKNAEPKIKLNSYGYQGGSCSFNNKSLSKIGESVGLSNVRALTAAAGPIVEMIACIALLYLYPGNLLSLHTLSNNAFYALSTLNEKAFVTGGIKDTDSGHDFICVRIYKNKKVASVLIITSVALAVFSFYSALTHSLLSRDACIGIK